MFGHPLTLAAGLRRSTIAFVLACGLLFMISAVARAANVPTSDGGHIAVTFNDDAASTAVRFDAAGAVVADYGACGTATFAAPQTPSEGIPDPHFDLEDAAADTAGNLYAGGIHLTTDSVHAWQGTVVKVTPNGVPDTSFGNGGSVITPLPAAYNYMLFAPDLHVLPDGHIVLIGTIGIENPPNYGFVEELNPNGTLDTTFGNQGFEVLDVDSTGHNNEIAASSVSGAGAISVTVQPVGTPSGSQVFNFQADLTPFVPTSPQPANPSTCNPAVGGLSSSAAVPVAPIADVKLKIPAKVKAKQFHEIAGVVAGPSVAVVAKVDVAVVPIGKPNVKLVWHSAKGTVRWHYKLKHLLKPGRYLVRARAIATTGAPVAYSRAGVHVTH